MYSLLKTRFKFCYYHKILFIYLFYLFIFFTFFFYFFCFFILFNFIYFFYILVFGIISFLVFVSAFVYEFWSLIEDLFFFCERNYYYGLFWAKVAVFWSVVVSWCYFRSFYVNSAVFLLWFCEIPNESRKCCALFSYLIIKWCFRAFLFPQIISFLLFFFFVCLIFFFLILRWPCI